MVEADADRDAGFREEGHLQGQQRRGCGQVGDERMESLCVFWVVCNELVEDFGCGLGDCEGDGVAVDVVDLVFAGLGREPEISRERVEESEGEGERVFEIWKERLEEVGGGDGAWV